MRAKLDPRRGVTKMSRLGYLNLLMALLYGIERVI